MTYNVGSMSTRLRGHRPLSHQLESWLRGGSPKTLVGLEKAFGEKGFGLVFLLLLGVPALPIPTGGITHIFELMAMLLSTELIVGRETIWLPQRWQTHKLSKSTMDKAIPFMIRKIRWFERYSRPRLVGLYTTRLFRSLAGVLLLIFSLGALLAPPFTGLDTLPALGGVLIALSLVLQDIFVFIGGIAIGTVGIGVIFALGGILTSSITHWL